LNSLSKVDFLMQLWEAPVSNKKDIVWCAILTVSLGLMLSPSEHTVSMQSFITEIEAVQRAKMQLISVLGR
jgi:hypothetical protein